MHFKKYELHDEWMKVGDVPLAHGLIVEDASYSEARKKLFPNVKTWAVGECLIRSGSPDSEKALYCESCRKAEKEWREQHP